MDFLYTLQNLRNPVLDTIMSIITNLGGELIVIAALCIIYWCINKDFAYKLCFTYFISGLLVQGAKIACRVERPWVRDSRLTCVESARKAATGYSFPSGHTQGVTGLFSSVAFHIKKSWFYIVSFVIIAAVMFSRMYLGCHTPQDVITAFAITIVTSAAVSLLYDRISSNDKANVIVFILTEVISIALIIYSSYVVSSGKSTTELAMDGFKAAGAGIGFGIGWFLEKEFIHYDPRSVRTVWGQIIKVIAGLATSLAFKQGLKLIGPDSVPVNIIRYIIVVIWVVAVFPFIVSKITSKEK